MTNRIRIYGEVINRWTHIIKEISGREREVNIMMEIEYTEYYLEDGSIASKGAEDFSPERYYKEVENRHLYTWDGQRLNKGGYRWFVYQGFIKFPKKQKKLIKEFFKNKYKAELVQLRGGI